MKIKGLTREPPHNGVATSVEAAESVAALVPDQGDRILRALRNRPMTCDELEVALNLRHQTASARLNMLARAGLIHRPGSKRPTRSGRSAFVWEVVPDGDE